MHRHLPSSTYECKERPRIATTLNTRSTCFLLLARCIDRLSSTLMQERPFMSWTVATPRHDMLERAYARASCHSSYKRHLHVQYSTNAWEECAITTTTLSTLQLTTEISRPRHVTFCDRDVTSDQKSHVGKGFNPTAYIEVNWRGQSPSRPLF